MDNVIDIPAAINEPSAEPWTFDIGQMVDHRDGHQMLSEVITRSRTSKGREVYGVHAVDPSDPNPDRSMLGEFLVAADFGVPS